MPTTALLPFKKHKLSNPLSDAMAGSLNSPEPRTAQTRYVAVDTTEFFDCPYLDSPRWNQLKAYLRRTNSILVVPEVVIAETKRHFRNTLKKLCHNLANDITKLNRWLPSEEVAGPSINTDDACKQYEAELTRLLRDAGAITPSYSNVSIDTIMHRCLAGRKPFDSNGTKGFRDAVIWESVVNAIKAPSETIFITSNTSDFGPNGGLAETLLEEIEGSDRTITICDSLDKFAEDYAKPALEVLNTVKPLIEEKDFLSDLLHQVIHNVDITDEVRSSLGGDVVAASIDGMSEPDVEVGDIYDLGEGLRSCSIAFSGHGDINVTEAEYEGRYEPVSLHGGVLSGRLAISVEITFRVDDNNGVVLENVEEEDYQINF